MPLIRYGVGGVPLSERGTVGKPGERIGGVIEGACLVEGADPTGLITLVRLSTRFSSPPPAG
jgi:hypothetical protein